VALDLAHRHAAGIEAHDLVVEAIELGLALGDQLRLEAAGAVARDRKVSSVRIVFELAPLRLLPLPRPAGSPFS
jgi:hypothetical protein